VKPAEFTIEDDRSQLTWLWGPVLCGLGGAVTAWLVWYLAFASTGYVSFYLAGGLGIWVGGWVRAGARGRGGLVCQFIAMFLSYGTLAESYAPVIAYSFAKAYAAPSAEQQAAPSGGASLSALPATRGRHAAQPEQDLSDSIGPLGWALAWGFAIPAAWFMPFSSVGLLAFFCLPVFTAWLVNRDF
jgi:hypothetical protein